MGLLMDTWPDLLKTFGVNTGIILIFFLWLTKTLIPQLQKERSEAIAAFQAEMQAERSMHREINSQLSERTERITAALLSHLEQKH